MRSLRATLLVWLLPPLLIVGIAAVSGAYMFMNRRLAAAYDLDLGDIARALTPHIKPGRDGLSLELTDLADRVLRADSSDQIFYAVRDINGGLIAGDRSLPLARSVEATPQFWDDQRERVPIRVVAIQHAVGSTPVVIVAAETTRKRERAARDALLSAAVPAVLLLLAAVIAVWLGVRRGLLPLEELRMQLQERSYRDLRPVDPAPVAKELRPVVAELNNMLSRLQAAQSTQTRFIANAAHQLRTPIAGMITQLDLARGQEKDSELHLDHAREAAARLARLARQILSLAAADPTSNPVARDAPCDLAQIVKDHADSWLRNARDIELGFDLQPAQVQGDALLLGEMAANLVDNACRYGARTVTVATRTEQGAMLEVTDDGPGIPASERTRIFDRFHRLDNQSTEGSGLGLAIVNEIAQRHDASVSVTDGDGGHGTRIRIAFPHPSGRN